MVVWLPSTSFYASSTWVHLRLLAGPFDQGLRGMLGNRGYLHIFLLLYFGKEKKILMVKIFLMVAKMASTV